MNGHLAAVIAVLASAPARAQVTVAWSDVHDHGIYEDSARAIDVDDAGRILVSSSYATGPDFNPGHYGHRPAELRCYAPDGALEWSAIYEHDSDSVQSWRGLHPFEDGGAIVVGATADVYSPVNGRGIFARYDGDGTRLWSSEIVSGVPSIFQASVREPSGAVLAVGHRWNSPTYDGFFARIDANGVLLDEVDWDVAGGDESFASVQRADDGDLYLSGSRTVAGGSPQPFVAAFRANLTERWSTALGAPGVSGQAAAIVIAPGGDLLVLSRWISGGALAGNIARLDATGALLWRRTIDLPGATSALVANLLLGSDGRIVAGGQSVVGGVEHATLVTLAPDGTKLWEHTFPPGDGNPRIASPRVLLPGGDLLLGIAPIVQGQARPAVMRVDRDGVVLWSWNWPHWPPSAIYDFGPSGTIVWAGTRPGTSGSPDLEVLRLDETALGFCAGDGQGATCPCGNTSAPGAEAGCLHSLGRGARLRALGSSSLADETLVLEARGLPPTVALLVQGAGPLAHGAGVPFGDGLLCLTGPLVRIAARAAPSGSARYPEPGGAPISAAGSVAAPGTRAYQVWCRDTAMFCTSSAVATSNGVRITWTL